MRRTVKRAAGTFLLSAVSVSPFPSGGADETKTGENASDGESELRLSRFFALFSQILLSFFLLFCRNTCHFMEFMILCFQSHFTGFFSGRTRGFHTPVAPRRVSLPVSASGKMIFVAVPKIVVGFHAQNGGFANTLLRENEKQAAKRRLPREDECFSLASYRLFRSRRSMSPCPIVLPFVSLVTRPSYSPRSLPVASRSLRLPP